MQDRENWEYISRTNFDHYWSLLVEVVGTKERKVYWDREKEPKQEREDDCIFQCNLASREKKEDEQTGYNHK